MPATLAQLQHLIALADCGSFTDAARLVNRSQAAFSRSIAELERTLGVTLVDRIGHTNELTPVGRAVVEHARHVAAEAEALERAVRVRTHAGADELKIGMSSTPRAILTGAFFELAAKDRIMRLFITGGTMASMVQDLRERRLDALIADIRAVPPDVDLTVEPLAKLRVGLLCRRNHPLRRQSRVRFDDLNRYPIASTSISEEIARAMVAKFGKIAHPSQFVTLRSEDVVSLLNVAAASDAIFVGALAGASGHMTRGELFRLPFDTKGFDVWVGLVRLAGRTEPLGLASFRRLARDTMVEVQKTGR